MLHDRDDLGVLPCDREETLAEIGAIYEGLLLLVVAMALRATT